MLRKACLNYRNSEICKLSISQTADMFIAIYGSEHLCRFTSHVWQHDYYH
jgi:hypothetical protein